jgi:hypothetical protein
VPPTLIRSAYGAADVARRMRTGGVLRRHNPRSQSCQPLVGPGRPRSPMKPGSLRESGRQDDSTTAPIGAQSGGHYAPSRPPVLSLACCLLEHSSLAGASTPARNQDSGEFRPNLGSRAGVPCRCQLSGPHNRPTQRIHRHGDYTSYMGRRTGMGRLRRDITRGSVGR